jgi:Phosphate-starvation-inducible E family
MADVRAVKATSREDPTVGRSPAERRFRDAVARLFTAVEDIAYIGLGVVLGGAAVALLIHGLVSFGQAVLAGSLPAEIVTILDRMLLVLMIVEILYTVQVSFREHALVPEPFLIVGLIATTRRILVLTAEFPKLLEMGDTAFRNAMLELGLLTSMVLALVVSLVLLRKRASSAVAEKA